jgi:hypothetical protein
LLREIRGIREDNRGAAGAALVEGWMIPARPLGGGVGPLPAAPAPMGIPLIPRP